MACTRNATGRRRTSALNLLVVLLTLLSCHSVWAATEWNTKEYDLYPGDFDGDGKTDVLYVAKDVAKASGIARSDGTGPNIPWQSWPSNYLGIPWSGNISKVLVADFNADGRTDIFLQRATPGDHYLLLADAQGKFTGIYQTIGNSYIGLTWSAAEHALVAGDFNGDGQADLFLQATAASGANSTNYVVLTNPAAMLAIIAESWADGYLGFKWSTRDAFVYAGNFNGDSRADLLIQARPEFRDDRFRSLLSGADPCTEYEWRGTCVSGAQHFRAVRRAGVEPQRLRRRLVAARFQPCDWRFQRRWPRRYLGTGPVVSTTVLFGGWQRERKCLWHWHCVGKQRELVGRWLSAHCR